MQLEQDVPLAVVSLIFGIGRSRRTSIPKGAFSFGFRGGRGRWAADSLFYGLLLAAGAFFPSVLLLKSLLKNDLPDLPPDFCVCSLPTWRPLIPDFKAPGPGST